MKTDTCRVFTGILALFLTTVCLPSSTRAASVLVECESFDYLGEWGLDQQFMDQMGSPYLLAHGLGTPVKDAVTTVNFPETGKYRVWVRTKDWVGQWKTPGTPEALKARGTPGEFQVIVNGKALSATFGREGAEWHWQDGGKITVKEKKASLVLHDLTGFDGRCDAILFTTDDKLVPPNTGKEMTEFRRQLLGFPEKPEDVGEFDLVVAGGGIAGTCAAVSAARLGLSVALIQDRPVLGGNNSSEVRVWLNGDINKEPFPRIGDVVRELEQKRREHPGTADMYEDEKKLALVKSEKNIKLFLDFRANEVQMDSGKIRAVIAQSTRTGRRVSFTGKFFADCTGDAVIGVLAGADHETRIRDHMGPSNLWNVKDTGSPVAFPRCTWALDLSTKPFPGRGEGSAQWAKRGLDSLGRWFWETGFNWDPVADREKMRDWNIRAMFGAWDVLKNVEKLYPNHVLEWSAYISGPRESRQILGDVILSREDLVSGRKWDDGCLPCTWGIDIHTPHPAYQKGFEGNEFISQASGDRFPRPYWVPYRCLYSRNIPNLFMAGRDISVTHDALGTVRVMRTCGMMGEIVGMAASLCKKFSETPRDIYQKHLDELKRLMTAGVGKQGSVMIDRTDSRVRTTLKTGWKCLGTIKPRNVGEIDGQNWTLGCETLDREFIYFDTYKDYIVPLGIKRIRLQGGWAKTEQQPSVYNFAWLDEIINDAKSRGLDIWLETDYGNPIYEGGGGHDLAGGFPTSELALAAWDKWVGEMAVHYKNKVRDWAMWNEPDINKKHTPVDIADFNIRTAEIIKQHIPNARIGALSLASINPKFLDGCMARLAEKGKLGLFTWVIYHGYTTNPDKAYENVEKMREVVAKYSPALKMWQGENGCPSERTTRFALSGYDWSELTQAKWNTRRMLGDLGHDVVSSVFTICDFDHAGREINRKGLLKINDKRNLAKVKIAYYAVQNVVSVFDGDLVSQKKYSAEVKADVKITWFAYRSRKTNQDLLVLWDGNNVPSDSNETIKATVVVENGKFSDPVWVDIITGCIYEIPLEQKTVAGDRMVLKDIPVYDAAVFITDRNVVLK